MDLHLIDDNYALLMRPSRAIGTLMPHVVVEETTHDELVITEHPVEKGAMIADHAFKKPTEIEMRCGWSDSTAQSAGYVQTVYEQLLALQAQREPFTVFTPKRRYQNMLVAGISLMTDGKSEYALNVSCRLREVLITTTSKTSSNGSTPSGGMASSSKIGGSFESKYAAMSSQASGLGSVSPGLTTFQPTTSGWAGTGA